MHQSSMIRMKEFVDKYLDIEKEISILDVGSMDVNGTYKDLFNTPKWSYKGLDMHPGPNVDIVSLKPYSFGVFKETYDVVISGQTLEHVEDMHAWMKEVSRVVKKGGLVCIIAPWEWGVHRHPVDCWRILPDGMSFLLTKIGKLNIEEVILSGSDCVGIARKGGE